MLIADSIQLSTKIGHGAFGDVFIGKDTKTNKLYAVKKVSKELLLSSSMKSYFNNEIYLLKHLPPHPNIIKFHFINESLSNYYVVLDYCNGGSLETAISTNILQNDCPFKEDIVRYITKEILKGLIFLEKNNIIHRDIKAENILLNYTNPSDLAKRNIENAEIKIIDFGFARYLQRDELASSVIGTPLFMDPKILNYTISNQKTESKKGSCYYNNKVDIWSLGIVVYQLLFGVLPFNGKNCDDLYQSVTKRKFNFPTSIKKISLSKECISFIDKMLNIDMNLRPSADELIEDKWINGNYDKKYLMELRDDIDVNKNDYYFEYLWKKKEKSPNKKGINSKKRHVQIENFLERIQKTKSNFGKTIHLNIDKKEEKNKELLFHQSEVNNNQPTMKKSKTVKLFKNNKVTISIGENDKDTNDNESDKEIQSGLGTPIKAENHFFEIGKD